jgi:hypothetical protein
VAFLYVDAEEVVLPLGFDLPDVDEVAADASDLQLRVETTRNDLFEVDLLLGELQHEGGLEVDDVVALQGSFGLRREEGGVG